MSALRFLRGVLIAVAGAIAASYLGLPLPWVFGALLATAAASFAGLPTPDAPRLAGPVTRVVIGILVGSAVDPELLGQLQVLALGAALVPFQVVATVLFGLWLLRAATRMPLQERVLCALPGGFFAIVLAYRETGGNISRIAIMHSVRVAMLVTIAPLALAGGMMVEGEISPRTHPVLAMPLSEHVGFWCLAMGGFVAARVTRLPGGETILPILFASSVSVFGVGSFPPPLELAEAVQVLFGMQIGSRLAMDTSWRHRNLLVAALIFTLAASALAVMVAEILHVAIGLPFTTGVLAFVPGGIAEMGIVAVALGIDPGVVAAIHLWRLLIILVTVPIVMRFVSETSAARQQRPDQTRE